MVTSVKLWQTRLLWGYLYDEWRNAYSTGLQKFFPSCAKQRAAGQPHWLSRLYGIG